MHNKILYFSCKNELKNGNDQMKKFSETKCIFQSGTFILFFSQDLYYLFSHTEFVSKKS